MAAAFAVVAPFFWMGNASGHDFEFHMYSWLEVVNQWRQGVVYPRWAEWSHYAYGEARFIFYPPASWTLGALVGAVLPWTMASGTYIWLCLTFSGFAMFALARRWLDSGDAAAAALFYAVNPYYLVIVYWRSAFAELLAGALAPLLLLFALRLERERWRAALPLSLVMAAVWLTNAPSAVMFNYSLVLLLVVISVVKKSLAAIVPGVFAIAAGLLLTSFYVVPAIYEQKWVDITQVLAPGVRPQDNFLFTVTPDELHNRFNQVVSLIAVVESTFLAIGAFLLRKWRREVPEFWWANLLWGAAAVLLMLSPTLFLWQHLPKLQFMQLPWRWLLCLNVPMAILVIRACRPRTLRIAIYAAMLTVIIYCWHSVQTPWWDNALDIAEMHRNIAEQTGYEGTDEYVPLGADSYEIKQDARRVSYEGAGTAQLHVLHWAAEHKQFTAAVSQPGTLILRLFNYPAWKVFINGRETEAETRDITGQLMIPVAEGENNVRVDFVRTPDRTLGIVISIVSLTGFAWFWRRVRRGPTV